MAYSNHDKPLERGIMNTATIYTHPEPLFSGCKVNHTRSQAGMRNERRVCRKCGSQLFERTVTFAVLPWRQDGRYDVADAIATYTSEARADAHASRLYADDPTSPYVARALAV